MIPTIGRIVHFMLTDAQAMGLESPTLAGDVFPAIITRVWETPAVFDATVSLTVFTEGDLLFVGPVELGDGPGQYRWPHDHRTSSPGLVGQDIRKTVEAAAPRATAENAQWTDEELKRIKMRNPATEAAINKLDPMAKLPDTGPQHNFRPEDSDLSSCQLCCYPRERHPDQKVIIEQAGLWKPEEDRLETQEEADARVNRLRQGIG